jgi:YD repeat-containing protein
VTEGRFYNSLYQLTEINVPGAMDMVYTYPGPGGNNGRITKQKDNVSGEEVNYQYDALNRLIAASTTDASWGLSFTYDGFGNRLNQEVTKGSGLSTYLNVSGSSNQITMAGYSYDANGNLTQTPGGPAMSYDIENRLTGYAYGLDNKRVVGGATVYFYTPDGGPRCCFIREWVE